ncbi:NACHT domain-containing protein [Streptomyces sp. NPDC059255]|uniref:NACHT domain-containing protein n=1 Tax=Streptomyces sp. NPDC059255 TaxID=3346793 RepID=UPI0036D1780F
MNTVTAFSFLNNAAIGEDGHMGTARHTRWGWLVLTVVAVGVAVTIAVRAATGEVDPGGLAVGLVSLMLAMVGLQQAGRSRDREDTDTAGLADRLAVGIRKREREARHSLLGGSDRTIDVEFTLLSSPAHHAAGAELQGTLEEAAAYYRDLQPGRLVITGAPGAGKTVLALHLMLRLLAAREPGDPVPVRLSLSTFNPSRNKLDDWLAEHLTRTYRLHPTEAAALVTGRLVIPVLDGLDEMDADGTPGYGSRAAAALAAMNTYGDDTAKGRLVLTCRRSRYEELEAAGLWAQDAARIDIDPVSLVGTMAFVTARARNPARWEPVLNALRAAPTGPLALVLSTPWLLTPALAVYDERRPDDGSWVRDPADLLAPTLQTPEQIQDHLLNLFIYLHVNTTSGREVAGRRLSGTEGHRRQRHWNPDRAQHWLGYLAVHMRNFPTHDLAVGGGLGYGLSLTAWRRWVVPLTGQLPWALIAFLDDACQRGILRQAGAVYQFRHVQLRDHFAAQYRRQREENVTENRMAFPGRMPPWVFRSTVVALLLLVSWVGTRDILEKLQNHGSLGPSDAPIVITTIVSLATAVGALVGGVLAGLSKYVQAQGQADAERTRANADMLRAEADMVRARRGLPPLETPPDGDAPQLLPNPSE